MAEQLRCSTVWAGMAAVDTTLELPGMTGAIYSRPAEGDEGGDIYLVSVCNYGVVSKVVLADVSGHGPGVARISAMLRDLLQANINEHDNDRFLHELNQQFETSDDREMYFATLACTTYFPMEQEFCYAYAGHPQIVLGRDQKIDPLPTIDRSRQGGPICNIPIGVMREARFGQGCMQLASGDWLVIYSDGLLEARNGDGQQFGLARLTKAMKRLKWESPAAVKNGILTAVRDFSADPSLAHDDLTLIVLRRETDFATAPKA